jgi:DNA-binding LacI/PurR family transcriptional regulator
MDGDRLLDLYRSNKSDGVILMKVQLDDWRVDFLRSNDLPFVMIGHTEYSEHASYVDYDFEGAMRMGLERLFGLGHRHIGYASAMPSNREQHGPTVRSLQGYLASCEQMGIRPIFHETDQRLRHVRLATSNMLNEHPEMTALVTLREMVEAAL